MIGQIQQKLYRGMQFLRCAAERKNQSTAKLCLFPQIGAEYWLFPSQAHTFETLVVSRKKILV